MYQRARAVIPNGVYGHYGPAIDGTLAGVLRVQQGRPFH
ncbi:MAG: hypothetical protein ACI8Y4_004682 [Candidatus Poriferisodalaceae bacterium]|jgi:hypothetical protein